MFLVIFVKFVVFNTKYGCPQTAALLHTMG